MQLFTADYVMSQHASDEITTKLNEMAKEIGLLSWMYHSYSEEWLMLWAYGGGQKTQYNQF